MVYAKYSVFLNSDWYIIVSYSITVKLVLYNVGCLHVAKELIENVQKDSNGVATYFEVCSMYAEHQEKDWRVNKLTVSQK